MGSRADSRADATAPAILVAPLGPAALGALAGAIRAAKHPDALAPVSVVVPSAHAAVSVRRHLAHLPFVVDAGAGGPGVERAAPVAGLCNVGWFSFPQLAESLSAPALARDHRRALTAMARRAAIRAALDAAPGRFAPVAANPSTEESLDRSFTELRELDPAELERVGSLSPRAHDVVRLFRDFRARCSSFADQHDAFERSIALLAGADARRALVPIGSVVVYLPRRLGRAEQRLLQAIGAVPPEPGLARRVTVVLGLTGDPDVDQAIVALAADLSGHLGVGAIEVGRGDASSGTATDSRDGVRFVRAPDPEEEVRIAIRDVLDHVAAGHALDDIAIVSRVAEPYDVLVHEQLSVAGLEHHGPASRSLAQTVAGRALVGFLGLAASGFRRAELFRWTRSALIRTPDGAPVPRRFDRLARRAGVAAGIDQWHERLDRLATEIARDRDHLAARGPGPVGAPGSAGPAGVAGSAGPADHTAQDAAHDARLARRDGELADLAALRAFVDWLAALAEPPRSLRWSDHARWADGVLDALLGGRAAIRRWPEPEQAAHDDVREVVAALASLDEVEATVDAARFARVLGQELARPTRRVGSFGHGIFVGRPAELRGARHELVVVLGMAEGIFPPRGQDDALVPDAERRLGGVLPDRRPSRADEHHDIAAAFAAAPSRLLSFARVDAGSQREAMPSRWFLRELSDVRGEHTGFDDLDHVVHDAFVDVASFEAATRAATTAVCEQDHVVGRLLATPAGRGDRDHPLVLADPELRRGFEAVRARVSGEFGPWTGDAGPEHAPVFADERVGSATSFEQWSTCPFRYFLSHVLNVQPLDEYADAASISPRDRGSLVHEVLESFIGSNLRRSPDDPWSEEDHARVRSLAVEVGERFEQEGRTGRPLLWDLELDAVLRRLETILEVDTLDRAKEGVEPLAVEFRFGNEADGPGPVVFTLPSGRRVAFRGTVDRIDRDVETGRLVVVDYKTGRDDGYAGVEQDRTCGGRHLQLVIYGEAARQAFGPADTDGTDAGAPEVDASYWFVEKRRGSHRRGGPIDAATRERFDEVLGVIVAGIESGVFPANPGAEGWFNFANCGYCDYDRVCPCSRDDLWEGVRTSGRLARYVAMAEYEPPAARGGDGEGTDP